jgi:Protein of unknown function (DUF2840)
MSPLTHVELLWIEGTIERWIRFGRIDQERILDRYRRVVSFDPGSVFAYVRWASNDYGTLISRIDILRACGPGEPLSTVLGVTPGGEILLRITGWARVQSVLTAIDAVQALGIAPEDVCPDHWQHVHNRISAGLTPRPYARERHRAWLLRRDLQT